MAEGRVERGRSQAIGPGGSYSAISGIPPEAKYKLFGKFLRVDNSDRRESGVTGLSLAIVKEIATRRQGLSKSNPNWGQGGTYRLTCRNMD